MPIRRFSTQAANADILGDDAPLSPPSDGIPQAAGADGRPRDRADTSAGRESDARAARGKEAKPGKDINAPGFIKDSDNAKP